MSDLEYYIIIDGEAGPTQEPDQYYGDEFLEYDFAETRDHPVWKRRLLKTKSPVPPPQSKLTCVKWCKPWPGSKICCGHKYSWRYWWIEASLKVTLSVPKDIQVDIEDCLRTSAAISAIAAIAAAISSGGAALGVAIEAFKAIMYGCLAAKIGKELISVEVETSGYWGDWE